jgi:hypothetical protein
LSQRGEIFLSTMLDCWKYSCHGATVVPMIEMMSSTAAEDVPASNPGHDEVSEPAT